MQSRISITPIRMVRYTFRYRRKAKPHMEAKMIGVFGSAVTPPGTPDYEDAQQLGIFLAQAGYAVMTGGYGGTMGAVSRGAAESGGRVVGVTVGRFKARGLTPNPFLHEEVHLPTLAERLNYLIVKPDAYVVLRGGVGTLSELALAWSLIQVTEVPPRPLVIVGAAWETIIRTFAANSTIPPTELQRLTFVLTVAEVVPALRAWWENPPRVAPRLGDEEKTPPLGDR